MFHVDETAIDSGICDFNVRSHFSGSITVKSYYDMTGVLSRTIAHAGPGPFTVTASAKGTTFTQQNSSFTEVITYNADGSIKTISDNGPYSKFTAPGRASSGSTPATSSSTATSRSCFGRAAPARRVRRLLRRVRVDAGPGLQPTAR